MCCLTVCLLPLIGKGIVKAVSLHPGENQIIYLLPLFPLQMSSSTPKSSPVLLCHVLCPPRLFPFFQLQFSVKRNLFTKLTPIQALPLCVLISVFVFA